MSQKNKTLDKQENGNDFIADVGESFDHDKMKTIVPYYIMDLGNELACNELRFIVKTFLQQNEDYRLEVERLNSL
jgi:hypothetical protein